MVRMNKVTPFTECLRGLRGKTIQSIEVVNVGGILLHDGGEASVPEEVRLTCTDGDEFVVGVVFMLDDAYLSVDRYVHSDVCGKYPMIA